MLNGGFEDKKSIETGLKIENLPIGWKLMKINSNRSENMIGYAYNLWGWQKVEQMIPKVYYKVLFCIHLAVWNGERMPKIMKNKVLNFDEARVQT